MNKETHDISSELSRDLSLFQITMMGVGMMIGAGVFIGVGNCIGIAGPGGLMLTFALNGIFAMFTAMAYAELCSAIPKAGGAYNFARIGFGRNVSFLAGWFEWFASTIAGSLYALTFAIYVVRYFTQLGLMDLVPVSTGSAEKITAVLISLLFIYTNFRGASETSNIGSFFTLGQCVILGIIAITGVIVTILDPGRLANFTPFLPNGWSKLLVTMGFTYVAFEGYEVIAQAGDEVINPRRNLPLAMIYSIVIVTVLYIGVSFATVVAIKLGSPQLNGLQPWEWIGKHGPRGFGEALASLMPCGNLVLTLAVIFASTSALNATIFSATRVSYAMGRDNMLPLFFAKISPKHRTPSVALAFTGIVIIIMATCLPIIHVASSASIMFLFLFLLVNACLIKIRTSMRDELTYGYMMPLFPWIPIIAIISQVLLAANLGHMSKTAWIIAPSWIIAGLVIYQCYSKSRVTPIREEILVLEDEQAPHQKKGEFRIMVAVANPDNALGLIRNTNAVCHAKNASVEIIHMVPVPEQVPLSDAILYAGKGKEAIGEMMLYLMPRFKVNTTFWYCRSFARGIISAVRQKNIDMLVMGWHGGETMHKFRIGSTSNAILDKSPCNVMVVRDYGQGNFKNILVPINGGQNSALALETAGMIAETTHGKITVLNVSTGKRSFDIGNFVMQNRERIPVSDEQLAIRIVPARNVINAIIKESESSDLIIIGATQNPKVHDILHHSTPEILAELTTKPLVMVKATGKIRSYINRWV